jgi:Ring finger domain
MNAPTRSSRSSQIEEHNQVTMRLFSDDNKNSEPAATVTVNMMSTPPNDQKEEANDDSREDFMPHTVHLESASRSPARVSSSEDEVISPVEQARRDEEASIELARALQAEEAMASYSAAYEVSLDYLRNHQSEFSAEDLAALQAAVEEENNANDDGDDGEDAADVSGMSYDMLLRLGDQMGDVKFERWTMIAQQKIDTLPIVTFESVDEEKANDCDVLCLVCREQYEKGNKLRRLPCSHLFHAHCVDQWLTRSSDKCPFCRTSVNNE